MRFFAFVSACLLLFVSSAFADPLAIQKIDPPNWWADFPAPMLMIHGTGLHEAQFSIAGNGVAIERTQSSANGHWAFVWLATKGAPAQRITLTATRGGEQVQAPYDLQKRTTRAGDHAGFSAADVFYLIMPDRFAEGRPKPAGDDHAAPRGWHGGDLAGITAHIDYLQQLGVTTVWTTPVVSNGATPESYHGYAATDLYAIDGHFGTLASYPALSAALHARGMKLVIDLVPNHVSILHEWIADPPAPEWLHGTRTEHEKISYDFYQLIDPHATLRNAQPVTEGWFTDAMPDLNQENPLVARALIDNALWWVETADLDGIRLDTFPYVGRGFWHAFHQALHATYPQLTTVGEIFHADPQVTAFFAGGAAHDGIDTGLDTPFDFPLFMGLRTVLAHDKPMSDLATVLRQDALYPHPERLVTFLGNHDTTRFVTEVGGSTKKLELALGLIATLRGTPLVYAGDEIAMAGGEDPDNRRNFPGGFAQDARNAFTATGRTASEEQVHQWTQSLLRYRAAHAEITQGIEQNLFADTDALVFVRALDTNGCAAKHDRERLLIVANKSAQEKSLTLPTGESTLAGCAEFVEETFTPQASLQREATQLRVTVPAESLTIFAVR